MKVSLNWLKELVELPPTVDELVRLLTMAGVEVEGVETHGVSIEKVVVTQILDSVQHPNADRLSVCQVDDGSGQPRQIVCGAKNYKVGDKVPLALPGAVLPGDFKIKVGKLRGVESQGMLCSSTELGLPKGEDGLLVLQTDAAPGTPLSELFPGDTVLDLEITPNRPDLLSLRGIAREVATLTRKASTTLECRSLEIKSPQKVAVADLDFCPLYTARKLSGLRVGASPEWLRAKLEAVGLRSINNVVDVTNLVLWETGQPLHAFDAVKLTGALTVRPARDGEEIAALDGKTYQLTTRDAVIADSSQALAIAGVMGGQDSGVTTTTTDVWLESARFQAGRVRQTSRRLGLSSDSSYRFERGVDENGVYPAREYASELILKLCGGTAGELMVGGLESEQTPLQRRRYVSHCSPPVSLRPERLEQLLGIRVPAERVEQILTGFGLQKLDENRWEVPSFRADLTREVDLIEEVARVVGMDGIPGKTQARFVEASPVDRAYDFAMELRRALGAQGLHEARNLALVPAQPLGLAALQIAPESLLRVKNPMIDDQVVLRPNLLHGLFTSLRENLRAGAAAVRLFEIGRVYSAIAPETTHAALVLSGEERGRDWRTSGARALDLFDLKGVLTAALGAKAVVFSTLENSALALSLRIEVNGKAVGFAGQLWPAEARALDAGEAVVFAEIDLAALQAASVDSAKKYREIARFPATSRDMALLVPLTLPHGDIATCLSAAKEPLLERVELFDIFTDASGAKIAADKKSLAYSLTYRAADRTLTASEVEAAHGRLKERLKGELSVSFRE